MAGSGRDRTAGVLTPLELEIMQVLWTSGSSTTAEVKERLPSELAYTTVQTMLNVLLKKKKVSRAAVGRAYAYAPVVSREGAMKTALSDLVSRMFGGSGEALLMALVDARQLTPDQIERASKVLRESRSDEDEG